MKLMQCLRQILSGIKRIEGNRITFAFHKKCLYYCLAVRQIGNNINNNTNHL